MPQVRHGNDTQMTVYWGPSENVKESEDAPYLGTRPYLGIDMTEQKETSDWDRAVAELQKAILEQEQALYSAKVLEQARQPQNMGGMLEPDRHAVVRGPCGDTMELFLRVQDSRIEITTFLTDGCGPSVACGSMLTQMVQGKSLEEATTIDAVDLIAALDGLPPEHQHCAKLAVDTLQEAIADQRQEGRAGHE
jgi:nitrogen fixation NifU-like protein